MHSIQPDAYSIGIQPDDDDNDLFRKKITRHTKWAGCGQGAAAVALYICNTWN